MCYFQQVEGGISPPSIDHNGILMIQHFQRPSRRIGGMDAHDDKPKTFVVFK